MNPYPKTRYSKKECFSFRVGVQYNDETTIIWKRGVLLKIGLLITHEIYQELENRGHYLGISKTSTVTFSPLCNTI